MLSYDRISIGIILEVTPFVNYYEQIQFLVFSYTVKRTPVVKFFVNFTDFCFVPLKSIWAWVLDNNQVDVFWKL